MWWLVWSAIQTTQTFSISAIKLFYFLTIGVFTGAALLIYFKNFSFAFTTWFTVCHEGHRLQPISAFIMLFSVSFIFSSFLFKVRDVWLFLSLEHLEVIIGLLISLNSIWLCLRELGERKRWRNSQLVEQSEHTQHNRSACQRGRCWAHFPHKHIKTAAM